MPTRERINRSVERFDEIGFGLRYGCRPLFTDSDSDIWIDTAGSDVDGVGTYARPYATMVRAIEDLPFRNGRISHKKRIMINSGDYAAGFWPKTTAPVFDEYGSLTICGVGAPVVISGPHTVTGVADMGGGGQLITVGAGGLGSNDSIVGDVIMILTGGHPGRGHAIAANTDTTLEIVLQTDKMQNGDTFNVVRPAVKCPAESLSFFYDSRAGDAWDGGLFAQLSSRLIIHNIWFDLSASLQPVKPVLFAGNNANSGIYWEFVKFSLPTTMYNGITQVNTSMVQSGRAYEDSWVVDGGTGFVNMNDPYSGRVGLSITGAAARYLGFLRIEGASVELADVVVKGGIHMLKPGTGVQINRAAATYLGQFESNLYWYSSLLHGYADVAVECDGGYLYFDKSYILNATDGIKLRAGSYCHLDTDVQCSPTLVTGSAMTLENGCRVRQEGALPNFVGAATGRKAYRMTAPAVDVESDTWLAADGDYVDDGLGAAGAGIVRQD